MMKNIFNRLGIVLHWGLFLLWPLFFLGLFLLYLEREGALPNPLLPELGEIPVGAWFIFAGTYIAPAILFFILKGRLILFPWNH